VKPTDPVTLLAVVTVLATVGLIACYVPARRATRIDASETLRSE
jgi:putative ABC transport system permease protein